MRAMESEAVPPRQTITQAVDVFVDREQRLLQEAEDESTAKASSAETLVTGLAVVAVFFAAFTAFFLSRTLSRQIGSAVQHVQNSSAELQTTANQQATGAGSGQRDE